MRYCGSDMPDGAALIRPTRCVTVGRIRRSRHPAKSSTTTMPAR
ncbi:hypothetical protein CKO_00621 [Citrobacter koseri ATCC BAA-895]|uniref:Uncharacterized protein n=1 Tax=Citrobacter koseri (strain ATCC BAA-895 / CDC 4225-83 / SGSC4696) TaxID=290338 RepID=A8AE61_CITK8|nr:hypothetical protein CKO_00621 [Citrobacter koseri ATCC BAA-895]